MAKFSQFNQNQSKVTEQDVKEKFDTYKDMNQEQLQSTLLSEVTKQKANGQFDYESLHSMVQSLSSVLPAQDYQKVLSLLESLK